jgi:hypothetical protein
MAGEHGPFDSERQALATRAAAVIKAAFDAAPGVGASVPESLKVMTDACAAAGVDLGTWDLGFLRGVAWGETANAVSLAGMVTRAYRAGKAGAFTEEDVRPCRHCEGPLIPCRHGHQFPACHGWKHAAWLSMTIGAHYCEGRSAMPSGEPAPGEAGEP